MFGFQILKTDRHYFRVPLATVAGRPYHYDPTTHALAPIGDPAPEDAPPVPVSRSAMSGTFLWRACEPRWHGAIGIAHLRQWIARRDEYADRYADRWGCGRQDHYGDVTDCLRDELADLGYNPVSPGGPTLTALAILGRDGLAALVAETLDRYRDLEGAPWAPRVYRAAEDVRILWAERYDRPNEWGDVAALAVQYSPDGAGCDYGIAPDGTWTLYAD